MRGIGALLDINGGRGLLARVAGPINHPVGQEIVRRGVFSQRQMFGETWVCRQGDNGVSRDQYAAVFYGLSIAHELIPALRPDIELRVQQMLDYLIAEGWIITEDRNWLQAGLGTPTPFHGCRLPTRRSRCCRSESACTPVATPPSCSAWTR